MNHSSSLVCVVTTIQPPTACVRRLCESLLVIGGDLIVIGDRKGPPEFSIPPAQFYSIEAQHKLSFQLARSLPEKHYARKNLGYLLAIERGAECIYETDDDNMPSDHWAPRSRAVQAQKVAPRQWLNVYRLYADQNIWPRGFPLDLINDPATFAHDRTAPLETIDAPIQQGLADVAPDVDAVWRLVFGHDVTFDRGPSVCLPPGTWCPFNSQTTWWWPDAYSLLYLPSHCSFRMTDIWRSFVAQRCLWEIGAGVVFHAAEVVQERNVHNLMRDFQDEVPGYTGNRQIVGDLAALRLSDNPGSMGDNLVRCYEALVDARFIGREELALVRLWVDDVNTVQDESSVRR